MSKKHKQSMYKGLPLVDASKDLEICVTKNDVSTARRNDPSNCAAANSMKRTLKTEVEVHIARTYVKQGKRWVRFLTPESISREITAFDRASAFEPGTFILKAPTRSQRLGKHRGHSKHTSTGNGKNNPHHITANIRDSAR